MVVIGNNNDDNGNPSMDAGDGDSGDAGGEGWEGGGAPGGGRGGDVGGDIFLLYDVKIFMCGGNW